MQPPQNPREAITWFGNTDQSAAVQTSDTGTNQKAAGARFPSRFLTLVPFGEGYLRLPGPLEGVAREDFASAIALDRGT